MVYSATRPPNDSEIKFNEVLITRLKTFSDKNRDYGTSYDVDGIIGIVIRLGDKLKRLKTVSKKGFEITVKEEGLKELFLDIGNYCDIGLMLLGDVDEKVDSGDYEQIKLQQGVHDTKESACSCGACSSSGE